jgi:hypothetical protein
MSPITKISLAISLWRHILRHTSISLIKIFLILTFITWYRGWYIMNFTITFPIFLYFHFNQMQQIIISLIVCYMIVLILYILILNIHRFIVIVSLIIHRNITWILENIRFLIYLRLILFLRYFLLFYLYLFLFLFHLRIFLFIRGY